MDIAAHTLEPTPAPVPRPSPNAAPQLRTLLLTDLVDSTGLVERLGDTPASELFRAHDRLVLQLQQQWHGRLIDRSDGLLLLFERPIDGLGFALDYVRGLTALGDERGILLRARAGLHVGEVLTWRNSDEAVSIGAKPLEVEGLAKPIAARLMAMARPGQILLSAVAEPLAHRAARELGERGQHLVWKSWGSWRFKGVPEPQQIFEVGEPGIAPLRIPLNTPKAWRDTPVWRRPAALAAEIALLAGGVLGVWFITRPEPAIAFNQRDWVVVGDLRNLTGQSALDDSLEQAFRISLEQSRHVNVLSDLKARDTLGRMQRPNDTVLDRAVASEIALRDGARAVILPTVAEIGGRVRVSAEVIDPRTQTTVYAESADGVGLTSTLESIDQVTAALRGKLGEAVKSIEKDSVPLPQVTTKNLDALRAYALGQGAYAEAKHEQAQAYFERALALDPEFALARMGIVRIEVAQVETARARTSLAEVMKLRERLPPRDALYLDAWSAEFGDSAAVLAPQKWKLLSDMYPDYFAGYANYAWSQLYLGKYEEALEAVKRATAKQNPLRAVALDQQGRVQLATNDVDGALESFRLSVANRHDASRQMAAAFAAKRDFSKATELISRLPQSDLINQMELISIAVDQGDKDRAIRISRQAERDAAKRSPFWRDLFATVALSVRMLHGHGEVKASEISGAFDRGISDLSMGSDDKVERLYCAVTTIYLGQRAGHADMSRKLLPKAVELSQKIKDPRVEQLLVMVRANQKRFDATPAVAVAELSRLLDGSEQFQVHVALRDALLAAGREKDALRENDWLKRNRGLAYAEQAGAYVMQPLNVADTTAAWPNKARLPKIVAINGATQR